MKLCKDCKHIKFYGYGRSPVCVHPAAPFDPVTGEKDGSCSLMRSRNCCIEQCGVNGDWFEQAPENKPVAPPITVTYAGTYGGTHPEESDQDRSFWERVKHWFI